MSTITNFPVPTNSGPAIINRQVADMTDYEVITYKFDDGGADVNVVPCGPRKWMLDYDGLSEAEAALLDNHYDLAKGRANDFTFLDREGVSHIGVMYESYDRPKHTKYWAQARRIVLIAED